MSKLKLRDHVWDSSGIHPGTFVAEESANNSIKLENNNLDAMVKPSANVRYGSLEFTDKNNKSVSFIRGDALTHSLTNIDSAGSRLALVSRSYKQNGDAVDAAFYLISNPDGTMTVDFTNGLRKSFHSELNDLPSIPADITTPSSYASGITSAEVSFRRVGYIMFASVHVKLSASLSDNATIRSNVPAPPVIYRYTVFKHNSTSYAKPLYLSVTTAGNMIINYGSAGDFYDTLVWTLPDTYM